MQTEDKALVHVAQGRIPQGRISTQRHLHFDSVGTSASLEHRLSSLARMLAVTQRSSKACAHLLVLQQKTNHRRTSAWSSRPTACLNASANLPGCHRRSSGACVPYEQLFEIDTPPYVVQVTAYRRSANTSRNPSCCKKASELKSVKYRAALLDICTSN